mgnify:CR=1 FL=1
MKSAQVVSVQTSDGAVDKKSYRPVAVRRAICGKLIDLANDGTMSEHCKQYGITASELKSALSDPLIFEEMWDNSMAHIMLPAIPKIIKAWKDKCEFGDYNMIKLLMQVKGKTKPETDVHVHLHKEAKQMDGAMLDSAIAEKFNMLKSLEKDAI